MSEGNYGIDYMIRVLSRQLERHLEEYGLEGREAPPDSIIYGWSYDFSRASLEAWIGILERHRHCTPAAGLSQGPMVQNADETGE